MGGDPSPTVVYIFTCVRHGRQLIREGDSQMLNLRTAFSAFGVIALLTIASVSSYGQKPQPQAPQPTPAPSNVNVINTPTVIVGNSVENPVTVKSVEPAREPYQVGGNVTGQCTSGGNFEAVRTFTVPQGKRFTIE